MIAFAPAKINIGLSILNKRKDGFHNLESILYPVPLFDIIEIQVAHSDELVQSGIVSTNSMEQNLVYQAVLKIRDHYTIPPLKIHLHKQIPFQSGLGGGSSDAVSVLKLINLKFNLQISKDDMHKFAIDLGSDCPFFIEAKPAKITGHGEFVNQIDLSLHELYIIIVKPPFSISTKDAFQQLNTNRKKTLSNILLKEINSWSSHFINDFEDGLAKNNPEIKNIKEMFLANGALYASLSGSGSAVYGLFYKLPKIKFNSSYFTWIGRLQ